MHGTALFEMRLKHKSQIINYAKKYFGNDCHLYLFGSRVDDNKKGGDIDLFLETSKSVDMNIQLSFFRDMYKYVTQRKMDLLIKTPQKKTVLFSILLKKKAYADVSKVISINILHFDLGKGDDYIYHGTTRFIGLHNHTELQLSLQQKQLYTANKITDLYPEYYLIELKNFNNIAKNTLDKWIYFLKNEEVQTNFTARGLEQAKETLDVLKMTAQ